MNTTLTTELNALSTTELEQLIQAIASELTVRSTQPAKPLDAEEFAQVLSFELKRHRKQKDEVFNPFA
ncbi:MAG TPA: hypothetical protein PLD79_02920 [Halothiobacillus sp.]|nr:MAG: hypothetical protein B7Z82_02415 [Halothiobacillus sp. 20-54-6]HQT42921.1 hypothetical protein [Halothiobacillus sp.]